MNFGVYLSQVKLILTLSHKDTLNAMKYELGTLSNMELFHFYKYNDYLHPFKRLRHFHYNRMWGNNLTFDDFYL